MTRLAGKRVLITGGARGIGLALARRFVREGAEILIADLDQEALPAAVAVIRADGGAAQGYPLDVTDAASIRSLRERLAAEQLLPDLLVNNAGLVFGGPFLDVPLERHVLTYQVNLVGLAAVTRVFLPDLVARPEAHVVNIASAAGLIPLPFGVTYASSKAGVVGFSDSLRLELELQGARHVRVTTVCPSYVSTGLFDGASAPRTTRILTPERLAGRVVRAVLKNRPYLRTPWLVKITPVVRALLPLRWYHVVQGLFGVNRGMASWKGRSGGSGSAAGGP